MTLAMAQRWSTATGRMAGMTSRVAVSAVRQYAPRAVHLRALATATAVPTGGEAPYRAPVIGRSYGGIYAVTLIPGDGIGKETAESVKTIFKACNVPVEFEEFDVSGQTDSGEAVFRQSLESLRRNKVGLKGILYTSIERSHHSSWNVAMRQGLDLYASLVLVKNLPGFPTRHENVDFAIIRENTEGEYSGLEHQSFPGVVESLKIVTRTGSERILRFAFDFAIRNNRKKVTCVHKANIMKLGDGLFLNTFRRIADEYKSSGLETSEMIVDNASMQLVSRPQQFDIMVMPNLYGNIVSNIGAGLASGPGCVPGCNIGRDIAVFEPGSRHVGLDIAGTNKANPTALVLSSLMMLRHLGLDDHAQRISDSIHKTIANGDRTADLKGTLGTKEFTQKVLDNLA